MRKTERDKEGKKGRKRKRDRERNKDRKKKEKNPIDMISNNIFNWLNETTFNFPAERHNTTDWREGRLSRKQHQLATTEFKCGAVSFCCEKYCHCGIGSK